MFEQFFMGKVLTFPEIQKDEIKETWLTGSPGCPDRDSWQGFNFN